MIRPVEITEQSITNTNNRVNPLEGWNTNRSERAWGWKERHEALPIPLLHRRYRLLRVNEPYREPDRAFVKHLKERFPEYDVRWIGLWQRWGLFKMQRAFHQFTWNGKLVTYQDYYPMMVSAIQGPHGEYQDLNCGLLRFIRNYNAVDVYREAVQRRDTEDKFFADNERKKEEVWDLHQKEAAKQIERNMRDDTGRVPDFSVPVTKNITEGESDGAGI